jgi:ribosomal protein S27E
MKSMITEDIKSEISECVCPECKNVLDLSPYPNIAKGMVIECNHCGMTLLVSDITDGKLKLDIVDAGK